MFIALTALTSFARRGDFGFLTPLSSAPEEHHVYSLTPRVLRSSGAPCAWRFSVTFRS